eukprot:gene8820-10835_t
MLDMIFQGIALFLLIFCGGQVVIFIGLILWVVWIDAIKPRMIPKAEIDSMAGDIIASSADPEREAFARHERAGQEHKHSWGTGVKIGAHLLPQIRTQMLQGCLRSNFQRWYTSMANDNQE